MLINSGMVNRVISLSIAYRDLSKFSTGTPAEGSTPYTIPVYQDGLRLNRIELHTGRSYLRSVYFALTSNPDGTGEVYYYGSFYVYNATQDVMIQFPDSARPYVMYSSPSLEDIVASPQTLLLFSSRPVSPTLKYYPVFILYFYPDQIPATSSDELCKLYYTN